MVNKFITIDQSLADLRSEIGSDSTLNIPHLNRYVTRCLAEITGKNMLVPFICVLTVKDGTITLPENAVLISGAIWGDHGTENFPLFDSCYGDYSAWPTLRDFTLIVGSCTGNAFSYSNMGYNISDNVIQLPTTDFDGEMITMKFWGYKMDCGKVMYPLACNNAVLSYIKMKLSETNQWTGKNPRITPAMYKEYQRQWGIDYRATYGDMNAANDAELYQAAAMVNDPTSGWRQSVPSSYWSIFPIY